MGCYIIAYNTKMTETIAIVDDGWTTGQLEGGPGVIVTVGTGVAVVRRVGAGVTGALVGALVTTVMLMRCWHSVPL